MLVLLANPIINIYKYINSLIYSIIIYSRKKIRDNKDLYSTFILRVYYITLALLKINIAYIIAFNNRIRELVERP